MARIEFNDGAAAVLESAWPAPGNRFANWVPLSRPSGHHAHTLADETLHRLTLRTDYGASFDMPGLRMGDEADAPLDIADRLVAHLINGGTCAVYTEDALGSTYLNCSLLPRTTPALRQTDARHLEYALSVSLLNLDGARMIAHYA